MAKETRIVFELSDIRAVRLTCKKCGDGTVSWNPTCPIDVSAARCHICGDRLCRDPYDRRRDTTILFLDYLLSILSNEEEQRAKVTFEIDGG